MCTKDIMSIENITNKAELQLQESEPFPETIPNSELQFDGDIACYRNAWPEQPLATDIKNLKRHIELKRLQSAMATVNVHTTNGGKSGREAIAQVNKYQEKRNKGDPEKMARVHKLREFLRGYADVRVQAMPQWFLEADDSMSIRQRECQEAGVVSKIMTVDKDLNMVMGNHIHYETLVEETVTGFGYLKIIMTTGTKPQKKVVGKGTKFFWFQVLMGDKADSIPGLPSVSGRIMNKLKPLVKTKKAEAVLKNPKATARAKKAAREVIASRPSSAMGQITAYAALDKCKNDLQCFNLIKSYYIDYYGKKEFEFISWRGAKLTMTAGQMFLEQARLLWMLRTPTDDVLHFFEEVNNAT